jgi:hypothetical protein
MYGRTNNAAIPAGLSQDHQLITIRAHRARALYAIISVNHFFEREEK